MTEVNSAPIVLSQPLTAREIDIAAYVGRGFSSKLIGHQLGISEHTVRKHRENIARKLRLRNAAELVAWSIRHLERVSVHTA